MDAEDFARAHRDPSVARRRPDLKAQARALLL